MAQQGDKIRFAEFFSKTQFLTQEERLAVDEKSNKLSIGVPKEENGEARVALTPNSIRNLVGFGHRVIVESEAGLKSNFSNNNYTEAGASIAYSKDQVFKANLVLKVSPITMEEIELMQEGSILLAPMQLPTMTHTKLQCLQKKRITAFAMELIQSDDGTYPIVRIMSEIAGISAMHTAAELLSNTRNGRGVLLGGISGVPPAKVVILGAGVVGAYATKAALSLGASVRIFDNDISKIMRLQQTVGQPLHTSSINPVYLAYQLVSADVVIGAIHSRTGRSPVIVTEEMVSNMKEGAVIIDVSIDQGGCIETSELTSHDRPTKVKHGVIHYGVPNIASKVSRTASVAVSNIITPILITAGETQNIERVLKKHVGFRNGCFTYKGYVTNEYLCKRFNIKYTDIQLLLTVNY